MRLVLGRDSISGLKASLLQPFSDCGLAPRSLLGAARSISTSGASQLVARTLKTGGVPGQSPGRARKVSLSVAGARAGRRRREQALAACVIVGGFGGIAPDRGLGAEDRVGAEGEGVAARARHPVIAVAPDRGDQVDEDAKAADIDSEGGGVPGGGTML